MVRTDRCHDRHARVSLARRSVDLRWYATPHQPLGSILVHLPRFVIALGSSLVHQRHIGPDQQPATHTDRVHRRRLHHAFPDLAPKLAVVQIGDAITPTPGLIRGNKHHLHATRQSASHDHRQSVTTPHRNLASSHTSAPGKARTSLM